MQSVWPGDVEEDVLKVRLQSIQVLFISLQYNSLY